MVWSSIPLRPRLVFPPCQYLRLTIAWWLIQTLFSMCLFTEGFSNCNSTARKRQEMEHYKMGRLSTKLNNSQERKLLCTGIIKYKNKMSAFTSNSSQHSSKAVEIWDNIIHKELSILNTHICFYNYYICFWIE